MIVSEPSGQRAPALVVAPVNTWQAYNPWGGKSLYDFQSTGGVAAVKVSFNRPFHPGHTPLEYDLDLLRWLEQEGYDIAYTTDVDVHLDPSLLLGRKVVLTAGHDEYWTKEMRDAFEAARDSGVNIAFMGANTAYWQARIEDSGHTLVEYRNAANDPVTDTALDTILFRDLVPSRPECKMMGVAYNGGSLSRNRQFRLPGQRVGALPPVVLGHRLHGLERRPAGRRLRVGPDHLGLHPTGAADDLLPLFRVVSGRHRGVHGAFGRDRLQHGHAGFRHGPRQLHERHHRHQAAAVHAQCPGGHARHLVLADTPREPVAAGRVGIGGAGSVRCRRRRGRGRTRRPPTPTSGARCNTSRHSLRRHRLGNQPRPTCCRQQTSAPPSASASPPPTPPAPARPPTRPKPPSSQPRRPRCLPTRGCRSCPGPRRSGQTLTAHDRQLDEHTHLLRATSGARCNSSGAAARTSAAQQQSTYLLQSQQTSAPPPGPRSRRPTPPGPVQPATSDQTAVVAAAGGRRRRLVRGDRSRQPVGGAGIGLQVRLRLPAGQQPRPRPPSSSTPAAATPPNHSHPPSTPQPAPHPAPSSRADKPSPWPQTNQQAGSAPPSPKPPSPPAATTSSSSPAQQTTKPPSTTTPPTQPTASTTPTPPAPQPQPSAAPTPNHANGATGSNSQAAHPQPHPQTPRRPPSPAQQSRAKH